MSTRSMTIVEGRLEHWRSMERGEVCRFYRHMDGYPEGHGLCMAIAAVDAIVSGKANNRNMVSAIIGGLWANGSDIEFELPTSGQHGDLEYIYRVSVHSDYTGGKLFREDERGIDIAVFGIGRGESYENAMSREPIFSGSPSEYIRNYENSLGSWHFEGCAMPRKDILGFVFAESDGDGCCE